MVEPLGERVEGIGGGTCERISDLAIEIRRRAIQRVIDRILCQLEPRNIVAEEALDVTALEIPAQVRARAIEDPRQREPDAVGGDALQVAYDIDAQCCGERTLCGFGAAAAPGELGRDAPASTLDRRIEPRRQQRDQVVAIRRGRGV